MKTRCAIAVVFLLSVVLYFCLVLQSHGQAFTPLRPFILTSVTTTNPFNPTNDVRLFVRWDANYGLTLTNDGSTFTNGAMIIFWTNAPGSISNDNNTAAANMFTSSGGYGKGLGLYQSNCVRYVQGLGTLNFNAVEEYGSTLLTNPYNFFVLFKMSAAHPSYPRFIVDAFPTGHRCRLDWDNGSPYFVTTSGGVSFPAFDVTNHWGLISVGVSNDSPASCWVRTNGVQAVTGTVANNAYVAAFSLGDNLEPNPSDTFINDLIFYRGPLLTNEIQAVEALLLSKITNCP